MTHTQDSVDILFQEAIEFFSNHGFDIAMGGNSHSEYGHSRYMYINKNGYFSNDLGLGLKVRVSNHSVESATRMSTEVLIYNAADIVFNYHNINYRLNKSEYMESRNYIDDAKYAHLPVKPWAKVITHIATGAVVYNSADAYLRKINIK